MKHDISKQLPKDIQPYERCMEQGAGALNNAELLAVILRTGSVGENSLELASRLLAIESLSGLVSMTVAQLTKIRGIGKVKAIQIKCIGELSKRIATATAKKGLSFRHPASIADYYMEQLRHEEQELLICMMLDTKNHLLGDEMIFKGTVNSSLANPREIFLSAVSYHAVGILLVHNHPSGDCTPSQADVDFTQRVKEAGELLGIPLLDHIIIGDCKYLSFREQGIF